MLKLEIITDKNKWEDFLQSSEQVNFLHSWVWGQMHQSLGRQVLRFGVYNETKLAGLVQLIKVKAKRATYFEAPGGPVVNWNLTTTRWLVTKLKEIAKEHGASFIRIRPNIYDEVKNREMLQQLQLIKAPMHLTAETTWVLPLQEDEETLFKNMRKTTRYLIKKAAKLGVEIKQSTDEANIKKLYQLQQETVDRKHFVPFSQEYFLAELKALLPDNIRLFSAEYKGEVLALAMILFYGREAVYHYSGSSNSNRDVPASYLLQWEVIKEAKKRGLKRYNFWGYTDNPQHRFYGPSLFKKGFGGHEEKYLPAYDIPVKPIYWVDWAFETLRRISRHL